MFVHAKDGNEYRIDDILSVSRLDEHSFRLSLASSADTPVVEQSIWEGALAAYTKGFAAASPGTFVLWLWHDENGVAGYNKAAVLGWSLGADGFIHAVTVNGVDHGKHGDIPPILHPDGRVDDSFNDFYESVEEWFAAAKQNAK